MQNFIHHANPQLERVRGCWRNCEWNLCFLLWSLLCLQVSPSIFIVSSRVDINTIFSVACGATMNQNNSYAIISSYSTRYFGNH